MFDQAMVRIAGRFRRVKPRATARAFVLGLLSGVERDAAQLTIPAVAERAGVNPTTIYRRWGTLQALLAEVRPAH